jgi:hypothetical protein
MFVGNTTRSLQYMATCLDQHLCHSQVNILHKTNYNYMLIARDISLYLKHTGVTGLELFKYVVIRRIVKIIPILGIIDSPQYVP